jgi:molecular chaperone DnaJ
MPKDYYKSLGIEKNATAEDVKNAFRRLAMEHHPDRGGDAEKFKEVSEAYQVLSDEKKRSQYDRFGTVGDNPFGGFSAGGGSAFGGNVNFEDFGDIFGGLGDIFGMGGSQRSASRAGADIHADLVLDFNEAVFGAEKTIDLYKQVICRNCHGSGGELGSKEKKCAECHGSGQVTRAQRTVFGQFNTTATCASCNGQGKTFEKKCLLCNGRRVAKETKNLKIKIPSGIDDGATLRVRGEGEAMPNAAAGDLYLTMRVKNSPDYVRDGYNIVNDLDISFPEAALGAVKPVKTVDGSVDLKIPAGTQGGSVIKLKNRGVPRLNSDARGDHLVRIFVEVPRKLSKKQKQLLEDYGKLE